MKRAILLALMFISRVYASGCDHYQQVEKVTRHEVKDQALWAGILRVEAKFITILQDGRELARFSRVGISSEDLKAMRIKRLARNNMLYSATSDCEGEVYGQSGEYVLTLTSADKTLELRSPRLESALNTWGYEEPGLLPLFER